LKTNRQKTNWIVDLALFAGFLVSFFLDITGLSLHQWLGVGVGVIAAYHLLAHWSWVKSVTLRFLKRTSGQVRAFYLLDAALMLGFFLTIMSGLVISTWLDLPLGNYPAWRDFHVTLPIATLLLVVLKLALHWRWIVSVAKRYILPAAPAANTGALPPVPVPVAAKVNRREFLKLMGIVGATAALAMGSALDSRIAALIGESAAAEGSSTAPSAAPSPSAVQTESPAQVALPKPTAQPQSPTLAPSPTPTTSTSTCIVRCSRGCSYPGRCSRYVDGNRNGRCDLGECL